ncbi:MAG TPA: epoxide hydrolase [Candidatus Sulfotelmatobacter sp.]|nr:epoxide hydrolase [Candidatus Sulfotelmatobacter sp.]
MTVTPFRIEITDADVADLHARLDRTRWPHEDEGLPDWTRGTDPVYLRKLVTYWRERYDWRAHEARLNALPQFVADLDGTRIHFVHVRSPRRPAIPLVLTHGWPGSFVEFLEVIELLGNGDGPAFDLVVPSLPGYAFSARRGTTPNREVARLWLALMTALGYERFGLQGGDVGAGVSSLVARLAPERVIGVHLNFVGSSYRPWLGEGSAPLDAEERAALAGFTAWAEARGAYGHLHRTTPRTPASALNDSPAGLASWIVEKFYYWSDRSDAAEPPFSPDLLLTNVSLYWFTGAIGSSMAIYYDNAHDPMALAREERIAPPLAYAAFPHEIWNPPAAWLRRGFNLQRYTRMPRGGHFAALEAPAELADDVRTFFEERSS